jgi:hypothetical protein
MSSMAQQAIEMGIDPIIAPSSLGGTWEDHGLYNDFEDDRRRPSWFATSQEALEYAKNNIGTIITRSPDGNGYIIK